MTAWHVAESETTVTVVGLYGKPRATIRVKSFYHSTRRTISTAQAPST